MDILNVKNIFTHLNQKFMKVIGSVTLVATLLNLAREALFNSVEAFNEYTEAELPNLIFKIELKSFFPNITNQKLVELVDNCLGMSPHILRSRMEFLTDKDKGNKESNFGIGIKYLACSYKGIILRTWDVKENFTMVWIGPDELNIPRCIELNPAKYESFSEQDEYEVLMDFYNKSKCSGEEYYGITNHKFLPGQKFEGGTSLISTKDFITFSTKSGFCFNKEFKQEENLEALGNLLNTVIHNIYSLSTKRILNLEKDIIQTVVLRNTNNSNINIVGFKNKFDATRIAKAASPSHTTFSSISSLRLKCPLNIAADNTTSPFFLPLKLHIELCDFKTNKGPRGYQHGGYGRTYLTFDKENFKFNSGSPSQFSISGQASFFNNALGARLAKKVGKNFCICVEILHTEIKLPQDCRPNPSRTVVNYSDCNTNAQQIEKVLDKRFLEEELYKLLHSDNIISAYLQEEEKNLNSDTNYSADSIKGVVSVFSKIIKQQCQTRTTSQTHSKSKSKLRGNSGIPNKDEDKKNLILIKKTESIDIQRDTLNSTEANITETNRTKDTVIKPYHTVLEINKIIRGQPGKISCYVELVDNNHEVFQTINSIDKHKDTPIKCIVPSIDLKSNSITVYVNELNKLTFNCLELCQKEAHNNKIHTEYLFNKAVLFSFFIALRNLLEREINIDSLNTAPITQKDESLYREINEGSYGMFFENMLISEIIKESFKK